jgi:hypothetical protein
MANVNTDFYFRSKDGLRSFRTARMDIESFGNVPMSREMEYVLGQDSQTLIRHAPLWLFGNRLLLGATPQRFVVEDSNGDPVQDFRFLGIVALDFDLVSSLRDRAPPAYDGLWTGPWTQHGFSLSHAGLDRSFIVSMDPGDIRRIYQVMPDGMHDQGVGRSVPIQTRMITRGFAFKSAFNLKEIVGGDMWLSDIRGPVQLRVWFRPQGYPEWALWLELDLCAEVQNCFPFTQPESVCCAEMPCPELGHLHPQVRNRIRLPTPTDEAYDRTNDLIARRGYVFEFMIETTGHMQLDRFRVHATMPEETGHYEAHTGEEPCRIVRACPERTYDYTIALKPVTV